MPNLVVCTACSRHVRLHEPRCPFCGAEGSARTQERPAPPERLSRAALYAFAAASLAATGCGGSSAPSSAPPPAATMPAPSPVADPLGTAVNTPEALPSGAAPSAEPPGPTAAPSAPGNAVVAAYGGPPRPDQPVAVAPPPAEKGKVEVATVTVKGGQIDNASQVAEGMRAAFGRCYAKGLGTDPSAAGQVTLTIRIGAAGQVLGVSVQRTDKVPAQVASCMTVRAGSAEFAPPRAAKGQVSMDLAVNLTP